MAVSGGAARIKTLNVRYLSGPATVNDRPLKLNQTFFINKPLRFESGRSVPLKLGFIDGYIFLFPESQVTVASNAKGLDVTLKEGHVLIFFKSLMKQVPEYHVHLQSKNHQFMINTHHVTANRLAMISLATFPFTGEDRVYFYHIDGKIKSNGQYQLLEKNQKYRVNGGKWQVMDFVEHNIAAVGEDDFELYKAQSELLYNWDNLSWVRRKLYLYNLDEGTISENALQSYQAENHDLSLRLMRLAVEKDEKQLNIQYLLALSYFEQKLYQKAIPHIKMALNYDDADKELMHYYLGVSQFRSGSNLRAQAYFENSILNMKNPQLKKSSQGFLVDILRNRMVFYSAFMNMKYGSNVRNEPNTTIEPEKELGAASTQLGASITLKKTGATDLSYLWTVDNAVSYTNFYDKGFQEFNAANFSTAPSLRLPLNLFTKNKSILGFGSVPLSLSLNHKNEVTSTVGLTPNVVYELNKVTKFHFYYALNATQAPKNSDNNIVQTLSSSGRYNLVPFKGFNHALQSNLSFSYTFYNDALKDNLGWKWALASYEINYQKFNQKIELEYNWLSYINGIDQTGETPRETSWKTLAEMSFQPMAHYLVTLGADIAWASTRTPEESKQLANVYFVGSWYF